MDAYPRVHAATGAGGQPVSQLRRSQRRLLLGGGGLVSLLFVAVAAVSAWSIIADFHTDSRRRFVEAQSAVNYYLHVRDRAYASSVNGNDTLWTDYRPLLEQQGQRWLTPLVQGGGAVVVRADPQAVPWLVLTRDPDALERSTLAAYLGMLDQYSTFTASAVAALGAPGPMGMYAYEPQGRLLAVGGVTDERQLFAALGVKDRDGVFAALMAGESLARAQLPGRGPVSSAIEGGRLLSRFADNPFDGTPSLVGVLTMADGRSPYFRRVVFEPVANIKMRLDAAVQGSYAVTTRDGHQVFASKGYVSDADYPLEHISSGLQGGQARRIYSDGRWVLAGPLNGVDWVIVNGYGWRDIWAARSVALLWLLGGALASCLALWGLLLRLDRKVFRPALADAARVYESEALSRVIVNTSPVGLVLIDSESRQPLVENQLAQSLAEGGEGNAEPLYDQLCAQTEARAPAGAHEFKWRPPGSAVQLQVSMSRASYRERAVWVCALRDVTAQVELERTLFAARRDAERAREAAESASRAKTAFVATMSHEIRTPLNGVLGHLELLTHSPMSPAQRERVERIRLSADTLLGIISDVLDFSKIEAGQLDVDPVVFSMRPLIEQAALLYSAEAQRKGVKLYFAIDGALESPLVADVHRIRQILNNLVSNAVKFTESGRIVIRADLQPGTLERPLMLRLQVVDSGIGLSEDHLAQLFLPFQQADASISRRYGGSGLGLALCQQLARLLGGSIQADSTAGVGSVFALSVPVDMAESTSVPATGGALTGLQVVLLSAAAEWRSEIGQWLVRRGAEVNVHEQPQQVPAGDLENHILLVFGERRAWSELDEMALAARFGRVVRAYPNGPLAPESRANGTHVSAYAGDALLSALRGEAAAAGAPQALPSPTAARRGRLLLVEDNAVNRELIQQQLEALGFAVDLAENGHDALTAWQPGRHRAVLTDINMPVMNGYELARALRRQAPDLPIFAVTATALSSERERCREAGITDLLLKPLGLPTLQRMLTRYLADEQDEYPIAEQGVGQDAAPAPADADDHELGHGPGQVPAADAAPAARTGDAGDQAMVLVPEKVRQIFVTSARDDLARLRQANADRDGAGLLNRAHAIKGVLMMLGERELGAHFSALEANLREAVTEVVDAADRERVEQLGQALEELIERYAASLTPAGG